MHRPTADLEKDPRLEPGALRHLRSKGFSDQEILVALRSVKRPYDVATDRTKSAR
jgi:hypothetical protein